MKSTYVVRIDEMRGATADLSMQPDGSGYLNRVFVPEQHRGQGWGREVMRAMIGDADAEGVTIRLDINPYGRMTRDELAAWYERLGFERNAINVGGEYFRRPR